MRSFRFDSGDRINQNKKRPTQKGSSVFHLVEGTPTYRKTVSKPALLATP
jgi:hypothetical protein